MKKFLIYSIVLFFVLLSSCNTDVKERASVDLKFGNYISAFTSGKVSKETVISVYLAKPLSNSTLSEKNLFKFTPHIDGETVLVGDRIIEYRPSKPLTEGTTYEGYFYLDKIIEVEKQLALMPFQFETIKQTFSVHFEGLENYEGESLDKMRFTGYLLTADAMDFEAAESLLKASFEGNRKEIKWQHDTGKKHFFTVDSLERQLTKQTLLKLEWNGSKLDIDKKGKHEITVPAQDKFEIIETIVRQQPGQHIQIRFSDALLKNQNLDGLVWLNDGTGLRLEIDGNSIKAWPFNNITGQVELSVFDGIANANNFKLKRTETFLLQFNPVNPEIRFVGKGVIVPQTTALEIPFEAIGLKAIDVRVIQIYKKNIQQFFQENQLDENRNIKRVGRLVYSGKADLAAEDINDFQSWKTYKVNLASLIKLEKGAIYRLELRMQKEYAVFNCGEETSKEKLEETAIRNEEAYNNEWDHPGWYSNYYYPAGYSWEERDNPCHVSYYHSGRFVSRNIFASELGIIAKEGKDHEMQFVVSNLQSTEAERGVKISLFNFQQQLIESTQTGEEGFAKVKLKKKPFFLIAQKGEQFGYLRLDDGNSLSTSNFNVSGQLVRDGIKGFIYAERGVWRPGDTLFVNFIIEKENTKLPKNYPVIFTLINPKGQITDKQVQVENVNNFYSFKPVTAVDAPTGNWRVEAKTGNVTFSKRVKIETVKPNRIKIELKIPEKSLTGQNAEIPLVASWLHGSPAGPLKAKVDVLLVKDKTTFEGFERYTFTNPATNFSPTEQTIFEGQLDQTGKCTIPLNFENLENAPGKVKAWFTSRVFEKGGDFSINVSSAKYSPFSTYVGIKLPLSEDNWYKTDTDYFPEFVLLDANGKEKSGANLEVKLYKINWRWWWESGAENLAHYVSGRYYQPLKTWNIKQAKHLNKIKLNVNYQNWEDNGRYFLWVKDKDGGHASGVTFYMSKWGSWRSDEAGDGATMLTLHADKEKYRVGEQIEIKIPSSKNGKALVSIENGTEISDVFWVKTQDKQTTFSFPAKPGMAPNFYVHISLIQPYGQTNNDAPLRLYGILPVKVEDPATVLNPTIKVPDEIKPESEYQIEVSEANMREMTYTLAIVDEGLLGLTNFRTPDPHQAFYAHEALGVKTWDMYDYVAGAYGAELEKAFAVGGDGDLQNSDKKKVSRFKPLVQYAGPFTLEKGKTNKHRFIMPNYIGAVRMMVVAGNKSAYGKVENTVPVRKGLMLLASVPRVLAPEEEFRLPVTVFAMKENLNKVSIRIKNNDKIQVVDNPEKEIVFFEKGEKMAFFNLKVNKNTGPVKIEIEASSGKETASYQLDVAIRNPNPLRTSEKSLVVDGNSEWEEELIAPGESGSNKAWIEISGFPSLNLAKYLDYLMRYPHDCIEQTTSAVFPQLYLNQLVELNADQNIEIEDNIRTALNKIPAFQLSDGGFAYWPGSAIANEWGTSYAGHFLLQAEEKGYSLPFGLKENWLKFQKRAARNWSPKITKQSSYAIRNYDYNQAYRLYTLALAGNPDMGAMNRLREKRDKAKEVTWRLAAAYVLSGQKEAARDLINKLTVEISDYTELGGTYGSALRDKAMILESLVLLEEKENAFELLKTISKTMNQQIWLSTQTASWCLSSAALFAEKYFKEGSDINFEISINGKKTKMRTKVPVVQIPVEINKDQKISVKYTNLTETANFVRIAAQGIPGGIDSISEEKNLRMRLRYLDMDNNEIDPGKIKQGDDFNLEVSVKHPGQREKYEELVLSAIFPSGWEILNKRLNDLPENGSNDFDYQDIRDDRIYTYFDLNSSQQKTFLFHLNASYPGKYYQAPVQCEAMYDFGVRSRISGRIVEVIER